MQEKITRLQKEHKALQKTKDVVQVAEEPAALSPTTSKLFRRAEAGAVHRKSKEGTRIEVGAPHNFSNCHGAAENNGKDSIPDPGRSAPRPARVRKGSYSGERASPTILEEEEEEEEEEGQEEEKGTSEKYEDEVVVKNCEKVSPVVVGKATAALQKVSTTISTGQPIGAGAGAHRDIIDISPATRARRVAAGCSSLGGLFQQQSETENLGGDKEEVIVASEESDSSLTRPHFSNLPPNLPNMGGTSGESSGSSQHEGQERDRAAQKQPHLHEVCASELISSVTKLAKLPSVRKLQKQSVDAIDTEAGAIDTEAGAPARAQRRGSAVPSQNEQPYRATASTLQRKTTFQRKTSSSAHFVNQVKEFHRQGMVLHYAAAAAAAASCCYELLLRAAVAAKLLF
jgi:hypothetical protein